MFLRLLFIETVYNHCFSPVEAPSAVLEPILSGIFELATPSTSGQNATVNIELARSTLVALNIVAQKQIKVLQNDSARAHDSNLGSQCEQPGSLGFSRMLMDR